MSEASGDAGVVDLFFNLTQPEAIDDSSNGESGRKLTNIRPDKITNMQSVANGEPESLSQLLGGPAPTQQQAGRFQLNMRYANGQLSNCELDRFPFYIGIGVAKNMGVRLPQTLCKGVGLTHLVIERILSDKDGIPRAFIASPSGTTGTHLNSVPQPHSFVWQFEDIQTDATDVVKLAPESQTGYVELWISKSA